MMMMMVLMMMGDDGDDDDGDDDAGVCHADELFMMFKPHAIPVQLVRSEDDR